MLKCMNKQINKYDYLREKKLLFHACVVHPCSVFLDVYSVLCLFF